MQQAKDLINQVVKSTESTPRLVGGRESEKRLYRIQGELLTIPEILWKRFSGLFGYPFTRQYGEEPTAEWEMAVDGLDPEMIRKGLNAMVASGRFSKFPPNPMEFRALCMPTAEELGLPAEGEAFWQAVNWSRLPPEKKHPAVLKFMQILIAEDRQWEFRRMDEDKARKLFDKTWVKIVDFVASGGQLPEIPKEIEDKPTRADKIKTMAGLAELNQLFGD